MNEELTREELLALLDECHTALSDVLSVKGATLFDVSGILLDLCKVLDRPTPEIMDSEKKRWRPLKRMEPFDWAPVYKEASGDATPTARPPD